MNAPLLFYLALLSYDRRRRCRPHVELIAELAALLEDWEATIQA